MTVTPIPTLRPELVETIHSAGRAALILLILAATLILANSALTAALALPETLATAPKW